MYPVTEYHGAGAFATDSQPRYLFGGTDKSTGNFVTYLYDPATANITGCPFVGSYPNKLQPFDQAVQYGGVVYMNNGFRIFLNDPSNSPTHQLYAWQYPPPAAYRNIGLALGSVHGSGIVNTTAITPVLAGTNAVNVASTANINIGEKLVVDVGSQQEFVTVTGVTGSSITAAWNFSHDTGFNIWGGVTASSSTPVTYQYLVTTTTTMPDGSISESSVDLNQYATPPTTSTCPCSTGSCGLGATRTITSPTP